jgi:hypothetical protein
MSPGSNALKASVNSLFVDDNETPVKPVWPPGSGR